MFARIINELAGLPLDDTETEDASTTEDDESSERLIPLDNEPTPGQTNTHNSRDAAHLTYSASSPVPILPDAVSRGPPQPDRPGRWSNIFNGAKRIIDNIIDMGEESDSSTANDRGEKGDQRSSIKMPTSPGATTAGFPTISRDTPSNSEMDLTLLEDTREPTLLQIPAVDEIPTPSMSEPSELIEDHQIRALISEIPLRYRQSTWKLVYSTLRDGISMQTMLRNARGKAPTVLVVRDKGKAVFGAFCSEPWKLSTRYYGTGETFVFQLNPREIVWHWWYKKARIQQNDYFMWGSSEAVAVGGAGGYAIWLDESLLNGLSRNSITFGNESLASSEEFKVGAVELWWLE